MAQSMAIEFIRDFGRRDRCKILGLNLVCAGDGSFDMDMTDEMMFHVGGMTLTHFMSGSGPDTPLPTASSDIELLSAKSRIYTVTDSYIGTSGTDRVNQNSYSVVTMAAPAPIFEPFRIQLLNNIVADAKWKFQLICANSIF